MIEFRTKDGDQWGPWERLRRASFHRSGVWVNGVQVPPSELEFRSAG